MMDEDEFADLGVLSERMDPESAFQYQMQMRIACRKAFLRKGLLNSSGQGNLEKICSSTYGIRGR